VDRVLIGKHQTLLGLMNKTNIIKLFEDKKKLKSKEIIFIKNYVCKAIIGYHSFEKTKPQKLRFNVEILSKQKKVIDGNINSVLNYEEIINKINFFLKKKYNFLESFANDFIYEIFKNKNVLNIKIKIEKLNIIKNTESVGIEFFKIRNDYEKL
jgi:FolB domain-containing protein